MGLVAWLRKQGGVEPAGVWGMGNGAFTTPSRALDLALLIGRQALPVLVAHAGPDIPPPPASLPAATTGAG